MQMGARRLAASVLVMSTIAAVAAGGVVTVSQTGRAFTVAAVRLVRGDTIRFKNEDEFVHQIYVAAPDFSYESDEQPPGTEVDVAFPKSGTFEVRCHIHPKMLLRVDVR